MLQTKMGFYGRVATATPVGEGRPNSTEPQRMREELTITSRMSLFIRPESGMKPFPIL